MDKNNIRDILIEHKERFLSRKGLVRRETQAKVLDLLNYKEIIVITGVRRCGKSSLMRLVCDELLEKGVPASNILYLNFDDERFIEFGINDFNKIYELFLEVNRPEGQCYFFLDEIQNVKGWERWLNRLYEFESLKMVVSGSNSTLLSSEISSALTGRNRQIKLFPFSFREFLYFQGMSDSVDLFLPEQRARMKNMFAEYLRLGGFPEVVKSGDLSILDQYFKDIIYRDVIARHSVRNSREMKELCLFLTSNIGMICSYKNIKETIGAKSQMTIKNYLDMLEDVYLFLGVDLFDYSIKKQIYNPSKIYSIDTALSRSAAFKVSDNIGRIYENIVFIELMRRGGDIFYWRSKKGNEVDFLVREGTSIKMAIQVCVDISDKNTFQRELVGFRAIKDELVNTDMLLLTENEERAEGDIKIIPLWKWLLGNA